MVPRLRQSAAVLPKTVVTVYHDANSRSPVSRLSFFERLIKRWFGTRSNSLDPKQQSSEWSSRWTRLKQVLQRENVPILALTFADVLVNTAMLILNYTMLVVDFFDDIEWSTAVTKVESANSQDGSSGELEYYAHYLQTRKAFMEKLNLVIYILIYIAQLVGFYGVIREIESLVITYVTVLSIQVIVLCFTVALRPFWLPVCLLRAILFVLALKQCLRLSNQNMTQTWDWSNCADLKLNSSGRESELPESSCNTSQISQASGQNRRRSQTMPAEASNKLRVSKRDRKINSVPNNSMTNRHFATNGSRSRNKSNINKGSIDETSVIEVMSSISHVVHIPVPASTFDTDSNESS